MKLSDLLSIIWNNMWRRKARTILTMIGVIIGSVSIFVLVSIGSGFQKFVINNMSAISDANTINVIPNPYGVQETSTSSSKSKAKKKNIILNDNSLKDIKGISGVKEYIAKYTASGYTVEYKKSNVMASIVGISMKEYGKNHTATFGKIPSDNGYECLIDKSLASMILSTEGNSTSSDEEIKSLLNKKLAITVPKINENGEEESRRYTVKIVGIQSGSYMEMLSLKLPLNTLKQIEQWRSDGKDVIKSNGYSQVDVVVQDSNNISAIKREITDLGFSATSFEEITKGFNSVLNGVKFVVGAIGAISLLVAAFGIANTMNMSIYERKKEIGVMKVIGASLFDVKSIFIGEASAIGFAGGIFGVILGMVINLVVNLFVNSFFANQGMGSAVNMIGFDFGLIAFVLIFSTFIGFLSGLYPASKAAKLDVISSVKDE
jgi:putative ABC transport system permease protein